MENEKKTSFIIKDIKKVQAVNTVLVIIAIGLNVYALLGFKTILITNTLSYITTIASLVFALMYTIKEYKKEYVIWFNLFVNLCILTIILQAIGEVYSCVKAYQGVKPTIISLFTFVLEIIVLLLIEFIKNMGRKAALALALTIFGFTAFALLRSIAIYRDLPVYIILSFSAVVLSSIVCVFAAMKHQEEDEVDNK